MRLKSSKLMHLEYNDTRKKNRGYLFQITQSDETQLVQIPESVLPTHYFINKSF